MKGIGVVVLTGLLMASTLARDFAAGAPQFDNSTSGSEQKRTLSFAERVAYQYALEEVYWRHRIWPKENPGPKPPLDEVMAAAQIEKKVEDYLLNSQLLAVHWQRPITPEQLQAEMQRLANQTKQPEVLQELFAVLGNDPFLIAECLARPVLSERLVKNLYAHDERIHGELRFRAESELRACRSAEDMKKTSGTYSEVVWIRSDYELGRRIVGQPHRLPSQDVAGGTAVVHDQPNVIRMTGSEWNESIERLAPQFDGTTAPPGALKATVTEAANVLKQIRIGAAGRLREAETHYYSTTVLEKGNDQLKLGRLVWLKEPFESWTTQAKIELTATGPEPAGNYTLPAIAGASIANSLSGCTEDSWIPTGLPSGPDVRIRHAAVWTGNEMIVWGGYSFDCLNTGDRYNPSTDTWSSTSVTNAPSRRQNPTAVWTGSEMIIWGGECGATNTGGRYNPQTDSWLVTSTTNAPNARVKYTAVWTGSELIVWGGQDIAGGHLDTGGRYNPGTNSWTTTTRTGAPSARYLHTAVWTGSEMIVWGGRNSFFGIYFNTGGKYDPGTNSWTSTSTSNAPAARYEHTAVWTGSEMIIWGGNDGTIDVNTGGRYNPSTDNWVATTGTNAPAAREGPSAVWTGNEMIIWGGVSGGFLNTGNRYNPSAETWTATSTTNPPTARWNHTAVWTGSEMIVWGGYGNDGQALNTGGRFSPSTDSWVAINVGLPSDRSGHTAVWTGSEMIIWGGYRGVYLDSGGSYNPSTDSWVATSMFNAPAARQYHIGVWTGSEMIIWGGNIKGSDFNTGGKYAPNTDSWVPTSITNVPAARHYHTGVWTGNELIVWGGLSDSGGALNTGGRYNPVADVWVATSLTNAPAARDGHTAVWTGSEMIVWGGYPALNTGGRYNPSSNSWVATNTIGAPAARASHTGVWTGGEMIVWGGGSDPGSIFNTGVRYNPGTDSWIAATSTNAPSARYLHTAVWTGSEMIIWGGYSGSIDLSTGGRYNPTTDSWIPTTTNSVPTARESHTAVWTGSEMIVWGGSDYNGFSNTGGRYCALSTLVAQSAVSRKVHGLSGGFNVDLPLSGTPGVECRTGGATNDYSIVVSFGSAVTVNGSPQAQVTSGIATVGSGGISNGGMVTISGNSVTVPLTNVANGQTIDVRLNGVTSSSGSGNVTIPMRILVGDTNANGAVNSGDVAQTKARLGQTLDATNFRSDVNANGAINAGDVSLIKSQLGTGLP